MLLLHAQGNSLGPSALTIEDDDEEVLDILNFFDDAPAVDTTALLQTNIQNFQFCSVVNMFDE